MKNKKIEVEGGELLLMSDEGHYAIIPAKHRLEVSDMVKDGCDGCINSYIQSLPKESDYAEDGSLIPGWDSIVSGLNPKNWGVTDYTDKGDFNSAYSSARKAGENEFMWNNKRYNTQNSGTLSQQMNLYGNTNERVKTKVDEATLKIITNFKTVKEAENHLMVNRLAGYPNYGDAEFSMSPIMKASTEAELKQKELGWSFREKHKFVLDRVREIREDQDYMDKWEETKTKRSHFNPFTNTIIGEDYIAEEAHGYRNAQEQSEISALTVDWFKHPFFTYYGQWEVYDDPEQGEYDTHRNVEPVLQYAVDYGLPEKDIPILIEFFRQANKKEIRVSDMVGVQNYLDEKGYKFNKSITKNNQWDGIWGEETKNNILAFLNDNKNRKNNK